MDNGCGIRLAGRRGLLALDMSQPWRTAPIQTTCIFFLPKLSMDLSYVKLLDSELDGALRGISINGQLTI